MTTVVFTPPATEPLTIAEVMAHLRLDDGNQEPAPSAPTAALVSPAAAGNVDSGAHRYLVTFVTAAGETQAGTVSESVTVVDKAVNGKVALSAIPIGGSTVTARKIYRTIAGGSTYLLLTAITDNTTTAYTDNIADAALGAGAPSTNTTGDPLLSALIKTARMAAEQETRRYLVTQTLDRVLDRFSHVITLPPCQSVTSITYVDQDGITQTLAADQYQVDVSGEPARITPAYGLVWPSPRCQPNAVTVRFVAGYGASAAVPDGIKQWMLMRISTLYENRAEMTVDARGMVQIPPSFIDGLLDPYRVMTYL